MTTRDTILRLHTVVTGSNVSSKVAGLEAGCEHANDLSIYARCPGHGAGSLHVPDLLQDRAPFSLGIEILSAPCSSGNAPARQENNGRWDRPTCLKSPQALIASTGTNAVCHARVRARGFRLVKVGRGTRKSAEPRLRLDEFNRRAAQLLTGFAVCNRPELDLMQFKQTQLQ